MQVAQHCPILFLSTFISGVFAAFFSNLLHVSGLILAVKSVDSSALIYSLHIHGVNVKEDDGRKTFNQRLIEMSYTCRAAINVKSDTSFIS